MNDQDDPEVLGDLDSNGLVDDRDEVRFFEAYGQLPGDVGFVKAADLIPESGGDGVIDDADYQRWLVAKAEANGESTLVPMLSPLAASAMAMGMTLAAVVRARRRREARAGA